MLSATLSAHAPATFGEAELATLGAHGGARTEETASYVAHHCRLGGRSDTLFSDDALSSLHQAARGLPRAVNNLARQALVAAYANRSAIVDEKAARQAVTEVDSE